MSGYVSDWSIVRNIVKNDELTIDVRKKYTRPFIPLKYRILYRKFLSFITQKSKVWLHFVYECNQMGTSELWRRRSSSAILMY